MSDEMKESGKSNDNAKTYLVSNDLIFGKAFELAVKAGKIDAFEQDDQKSERIRMVADKTVEIYNILKKVNQ